MRTQMETRLNKFRCFEVEERLKEMRFQLLNLSPPKRTGGIKMKTTVLCYERCSTCKKALNWLKEQGVEYEQRPIKEQNPTKEELTEWYRRSGLPLKRFFNTSGNLYKEMNLKEKLASMSEEEQLALLSTDGMLVKRPLVVTKDHILTGFKEEEWKVLLNEN